MGIMSLSSWDLGGIRLYNLNEALRIQLDSYFLGIPNGTYAEEDYCCSYSAFRSTSDGSASAVAMTLL